MTTCCHACGHIQPPPPPRPFIGLHNDTDTITQVIVLVLALLAFVTPFATLVALAWIQPIAQFMTNDGAGYT